MRLGCYKPYDFDGWKLSIFRVNFVDDQSLLLRRRMFRTRSIISLLVLLVFTKAGSLKRSVSRPQLRVPPIPGPPKWTNLQAGNGNLRSELAGSTVRFSCRASGAPQPTIRWLKNGKPIAKNGRIGGYKMRRNGRFLIMDSVVPSDDGTYTCTVSNYLGSIQREFTLNVQERVSLRPSAFSTNQTVYVGENATLQCKAYNSLQVKWIRNMNGSLIEPSGQETEPTSEGGIISSLVFHNVTESNSGRYTCLAGNTIGIGHVTVWLDVLPVMESDISDEVFMDQVLAKMKRLSPSKRREFRIQVNSLISKFETAQQ